LATDIYSVSLIQQLFDGLVQFDKDLNVIPALAKSWKISPDGLTYNFSLRKDVKFHQGKEMTAEDVIFSLSRVLDPKVKSPAANLLSRVVGAKEFQDGAAPNVRGLTAPDRDTIVIRLSEPYSPFLSVLGMNKFKVLPRSEVEKSDSGFGKAPAGTGPFKFVSMKEGEEVVLEANQDYFEGRPYLDKIVFKIFHGSPLEVIFKEFMEGRLDEAPIPFKEYRETTDSKSFHLVRKPLLSLRFYGLQVRTKPLDNRKVRQAINLAINLARIDQEVFQGKDSITHRILPLGMPGFSAGKNPYPYDPKKARQLLTEAGYPDGKGMPALELWSASRSEITQRELELVKSNLADVGIQLQVRYETDWNRFEERLISSKTPLYRYAWYADFPDPDNFLGTLFHSKSRYNFSNYVHPEVDRLLDRAKTERDYLKRMEMYRRIEEVVLEDAPIVPTVNHLFQWVYRPYVKGIELSALGGAYIPMKKIWLSKGN
jgi:peptide/nickel transport system substrate-binding protein/oligopeptide transport system substrate-binding protein